VSIPWNTFGCYGLRLRIVILPRFDFYFAGSLREAGPVQGHVTACELLTLTESLLTIGGSEDLFSRERRRHTSGSLTGGALANAGVSIADQEMPAMIFRYSSSVKARSVSV
jgi:hypothetical protein